MSRRSNLLAIFGIIGVWILLLVAAANHRLFSAAFRESTSIAVSNFHAAPLSDKQRSLPEAATIADILVSERDKIAKEMENFKYPSDTKKSTYIEVEKVKPPMHSVIIGTWSSGLTFLGEILNELPGNFYHYEPLVSADIQQLRQGTKAAQALRNLKNLLHCNFTDMSDYLDHAKANKYIFEHNARLWDVCKNSPHFCWRSEFLTPFCKLFPLQSMRIVGLRLTLAEQLLEDSSLNVHMLFLLRDPRGTMAARKQHNNGCVGIPDCNNASILCEDLVADYGAAEALKRKYPFRFKILRYEDFLSKPSEMTKNILEFYGLPFDWRIEKFLQMHANSYRSRINPKYFESNTEELKNEEIQQIQSKCAKAMKLWGYDMVNGTSRLKI